MIRIFCFPLISLNNFHRFSCVHEFQFISFLGTISIICLLCDDDDRCKFYFLFLFLILFLFKLFLVVFNCFSCIMYYLPKCSPLLIFFNYWQLFTNIIIYVILLLTNVVIIIWIFFVVSIDSPFPIPPFNVWLLFRYIFF